MDARVIVIGGGLSGLTTAYALNRAGVDVMVLEREERPGGCIKTSRKQGFLVEHGPNSMLVNRQQVLDFLHELGLDDQLLEANDAANKRYIVKNGKLHPLPSSPLAFLGTPLFSARDKLGLFREPFIKRGPRDESVADFVRRRLGNGFYDYAINPFVSGVYAGDPEKLLARAAIKKVWALEEKHGSLIRGAIAIMTGRDRPPGRIKGKMISFKEGMAVLPSALAKKLKTRMHTGIQVKRLVHEENGAWTVIAEGRQFSAQHLVLATPAKATADLLEPFSKEAAQALRSIPYAPVTVAHFGFDRKHLKHPLDGFGCLIPRKEGITTLGALFSSTLFPGRLPTEESALLTCFIGGSTFTGIRDWQESQVRDQVLADLQRTIGMDGEPRFSNFERWSEAIPQYTFGHDNRLDMVDSTLNSLGNISARANWRDGISVPDCILNALAHGAELSKEKGPR